MYLLRVFFNDIALQLLTVVVLSLYKMEVP